MTELSTSGRPDTPAEVRGVSLVQLAMRRLRRHRPAMAGFAVVLAVAVFSFVGPFLVAHSYDEIFTSYVAVPPSLEPLPREDTLRRVFEDAARKGRVRVEAFDAAGATFTATIAAEKPMDA